MYLKLVSTSMVNGCVHLRHIQRLSIIKIIVPSSKTRVVAICQVLVASSLSIMSRDRISLIKETQVLDFLKSWWAFS